MKLKLSVRMRKEMDYGDGEGGVTTGATRGRTV